MRREDGDLIFSLDEFNRLLDTACDRDWFRTTEISDDISGSEPGDSGYFWTVYRLGRGREHFLEFTVQNFALIEETWVHTCLFDETGDSLNGNFVSVVNGPGAGWMIEWRGFDVEDGNGAILDEEQLSMEVRRYFSDVSKWPEWLSKLDGELRAGEDSDEED